MEATIRGTHSSPPRSSSPSSIPSTSLPSTAPAPPLVPQYDIPRSDFVAYYQLSNPLEPDSMHNAVLRDVRRNSSLLQFQDGLDESDESGAEDENNLRPRTRGLVYDEDDEGEALRVLFDYVNSAGRALFRDDFSDDYQSPLRSRRSGTPTPTKRKRGGKGTPTPTKKRRNLLSSTPEDSKGRGKAVGGSKKVKSARKRSKGASYFDAYPKNRSNASLALLDFMRRNQYVEDRDENSKPREFEKVLPDYDNLGRWETLTECSGDLRSRDVIAFTFPALSSSDQKRAHSVLVPQLVALTHHMGNSKFPMYEHFYAEIDKPFYDHSLLLSFMASQGLPSGTKLNREEWNVVKTRAIEEGASPFNPKRPSRRLFSPRFVAGQISALQDYRAIAREIQADPNAHPSFPYAVSSKVPVGSTCTAFNSKHKIIHRGVILADTAPKETGPSGYVVQFERTALGVKFLPDTLVSCHGIRPKAIREATDPIADLSNPYHSLRVIPHGTSQGPLLNHTRLQNAAFYKIKAIEEVKKYDEKVKFYDSRMSSRYVSESERSKRELGDDSAQEDQSVAVANSTSSLATLDSLSTNKVREVSRKLDDMAENESLISLHSNLGKLLQRKEYLLGTLETLKSIESEIPPEILATDEYILHKKWVVNNLTITNRYLSAGMGLLQTLYSELYAGKTPHDLSDSEACGVVKVLLEKKLSDGIGVSRDDKNSVAAAKDIYMNALVEIELEEGTGKQEDGEEVLDEDEEVEKFCRSSEVILRLLQAASNTRTQNIGPCLLALEAAVETLKPLNKDPPLYDMYLGLVSSVGKVVLEISISRMVATNVP